MVSPVGDNLDTIALYQRLAAIEASLFESHSRVKVSLERAYLHLLRLETRAVVDSFHVWYDQVVTSCRRQ